MEKKTALLFCAPSVLGVYLSTETLLGIILVLLILLFIIYVAQPTKLTINNGLLRISGFYGKTIDMKRIENVWLSDSIPTILLRTNGLGLGPLKKGYFRVKGLGKCTLYLNGIYNPYLFIKTIDGEIIIWNNKDGEYLYEVYTVISKYNKIEE